MIEIFVLSLIQGITEFIPVSSSSHLIIISKYLNFDNQSLSIDVSLHIGSFVAVLFYFRKEITSLIKDSIPDAKIEIKDLMGDSNHYSAIITSKVFNGISKIEQHKLVYKSLKGKMGNELHALSITTQGE